MFEKNIRKTRPISIFLALTLLGFAFLQKSRHQAVFVTFLRHELGSLKRQESDSVALYLFSNAVKVMLPDYLLKALNWSHIVHSGKLFFVIIES